MDKRIITPYVKQFFKTNVLPNLQEFIKIPNCSPNYDQDWEKEGFAEQACKFLSNWALSLGLKNATITPIKDPGHTHFIYIDIAATNTEDNRSILMYGHMDKQPAFTGWSEGLGPQIPVIKGNLLYGRGSSDDGYAIFAALSSVKACQDNNYPLPRIIVMIEGEEESSTVDLFYYVNQLKKRIGEPELIICLDSGCADYERLWVTTDLRGVFTIDLKVSVMTEGVHSGVAGGIVPDSFMILRQLLDRIEDQDTGDLKEKSLYVELPEERNKQIDEMIKVVGEQYLKNIPFYQNTHPLDSNLKDTIIRNTWKPTLTIIGCGGLPEYSTAGNVLRPLTELKLSIRLPPGVDALKAANTIKKILELDPPYNAVVEANILNTGDGWTLNQFSNKLKNILEIASNRFFNQPMCFFGEGGSVPFVNLFNTLFPKADFAVLGVCGPTSNIHGPDENLNLDFCQKLMMSLTYLISEY